MDSNKNMCVCVVIFWKDIQETMNSDYLLS